MKTSFRVLQMAVVTSLLIMALGHGSLTWRGSAQFERGKRPTPTPANKPTTPRVPAATLPRPPAASALNIPRATWPEFVTVTLDQYGRLLHQTTKRADYFTENLGNGVTLDMVKIPGGSFEMGSPTSATSAAQHDGEEGPQHRVNVPPFWMGKVEVTQRQWQAVMGSNPSYFKGDGNLPVERVSWNDAQEFLRRLNDKLGRRTEPAKYRLPSEAQWEYAARAGTTTPFTFGETITPQIVNYKGNYNKTIPVGSLGVANTFGLFDMSGNVWEWCEDVWHNSYGGQHGDPPSDGSAWVVGGDSSYRALRGGSWYNVGDFCRSALRSNDMPAIHNSTFGLRLVVRSRAL